MKWYAIWVLSNSEFVVEDALQALGFATYVPSQEETVQWSDRKKIVRRVLFRGYVFALMSRAAVNDALRIAGVIQLLPTNHNPEPISTDDIENVRLALAQSATAKPCEYAQGDEVVIDRGPFAGVKGIVQRTKNGTRVVVKIEALKRAIAVEVDAEDLVKEVRGKQAA